MTCNCGGKVLKYKTLGLCNACYKRKWYHENLERRRAKGREYAEKYTLHRSQVSKRHREKRKQEVVEAYGGRCSCPGCPETQSEFLTIHHINGNGKEHRREIGGTYRLYQWLKERNFPTDNFQLLCMNCNWAAYVYGNGKCPHQNNKDHNGETNDKLGTIRAREGLV